MKSDERNPYKQPTAGAGVQVALRPPPLLERFQHFRKKELFTDLCVVYGCEKHLIHSAMLAASSQPICRLLEEAQTNRKEYKWVEEISSCPDTDATNDRYKMNKGGSEVQEAGLYTPRLSNPCSSNLSGEMGVTNSENNCSKRSHVLSVPIRKSRDCMTLTLSDVDSGVRTLSVEGVEPRVMNHIIQYVYWEEFIISSVHVHDFVSIARSLELQGCESVCASLQYAIPGEVRCLGKHDHWITSDSTLTAIGESRVYGATIKTGSTTQDDFSHSVGEVDHGHSVGEVDHGFSVGEVDHGFSVGEVDHGFSVGEVDHGFSVGEVDHGFSVGEVDHGFSVGEVDHGFSVGGVDHGHSVGGVDHGHSVGVDHGHQCR
ncbi:uncharacterized protein [Procambarus clarkii]|uniref:uncharacterized protein n=1 Tax=Procambarus clarkii TaxID=6728 RepID=UPI003743E25E